MLDIARKYVIIKMINMIDMNLITVMVLGMAVWRLTSLLSVEEGPFRMFVKIREKIGITHYDNGMPVQYPNTFFGKLFACVWCLSVWVSGGLVMMYIFLPDFTIIFSLWLSLSTIAILIDRTG